MNIVYSFNKKGFEAEYWSREIANASDDEFKFIPFNHDPYLDVQSYIRAQLLDDLYFRKHPGLLKLYADFSAFICEHDASAIIVDNCPPYHPEYLRNLPVYRVLRIADGPMTAYDRDFAYVHAYDHIFYHSPAYSADLDMAEKLRYLGAGNIDLWLLAAFDQMRDPSKTENTILTADRDIDIIFIGSLFRGKVPLIAQVKKAFGSRCRIHGRASWRGNLYFSAQSRYPGWVRPVAYEDYVPLYQRAKIGFNVHNRGDFTVGSYRLFDLPANGVMQISDGGEYLNSFFEVGEEIVGYKNADDLVDKLRYYLEHDHERRRIALNGYRRVMKDHRIRDRMRQAGDLIRRGMSGMK